MRRVLFAILFLAFSSPRPARAEELDVQFHAQNTIVWCWAAAIAMVGDYVTGNTAEDCQVLAAYDRMLNGPGLCCQYPAPCTRTGGSQEIAVILGNIFGLTGRHFPRPLSYAELKDQIDANQPMIAALSTGFSGHAVVITGYEDPNLVIVLDPMSGRQVVPYPQLRASWQHGFWSETFTVGASESGTAWPHGRDSCEYANDGQCDEPDLCPKGTDTTDCSKRRTDESLYCCDTFGNARCQIVVNPGPIGSPCWCAGIPGTGVTCSP
jgi:hypothetical protein